MELIKKTTSLNHWWSRLIIEELIRNGIDYFCISPGSRSTPLVTAAAQNPQAKKIIVYDERGAAFHALGYARATQKPAVLISTSGTAVANYFPAVVEAAHSGLPLLILSADRPPELRGTGANQTIDQVKIFGGYIKDQFDLPAPDPAIPARMVLTTVDRMIFSSLKNEPGPVQLNCMFREPLTPGIQATATPSATPLFNWQKSRQPFTRYHAVQRHIPDDELKKIAALLNATSNGLVILGRATPLLDKTPLLHFLKKLNWPVFADITSGFRLAQAEPPFVPYFDLLLSARDHKPDVVLHLGNEIVSKRWLQQCEENPPAQYLMINDSAARFDPVHIVSRKYNTPIDDFCKNIVKWIKPKPFTKEAEEIFGFSRRIAEIIKTESENQQHLNGPDLSRILSEMIPPEHGLFLASSLPVREMQRFGLPQGALRAVAANRGASGIDGIVASACGFAVGLKRPVTLLIGDLALLHDLNSLHLLSRIEQPVVIVVNNNFGGGIFHFLPIAEYKELFTPYFATPHTLNFEAAATMFGLAYERVLTKKTLKNTYIKAAALKHSFLIEVQTNREENFIMQQHITEKIKTAIGRTG